AGTELRSLSVPGRFDDRDVVHVIAENLKIQGEPGGALLETSRPPVDLVTLAPRVGGGLAGGTYTYKLVFVDRNGFEGRPSETTASVALTAGNGTVQLNGLPPVSGNFVTRRLYRSQPGGAGPYNLIAALDATDGTYVDRGTVAPSLTNSLLERDPPTVRSVTLAQREDVPGARGVAPGSYTYRVVLVDLATGQTGPASDATNSVAVTAPASPLNIRVVDLAGLPPAAAGQEQWVYRSAVGGGGTYVLVGKISAGATAFTDEGTVLLDAEGQAITLDPRLTGVVRARPDGRLKIDPGTVVKLEGARIEVAFGAQLIAEGLDGQEVVFTSKLDDSYGAGGTFDTNKDDGLNEATPSRGDWGGIWAGHLGQLNLDHAYIAFGGGDDNKIEGTFKGFNVIEIHQADARIANSVIEQNARGTGGQGPAARFGRGPNDGATIFVRGAQPVILNNIMRDNDDVAITINIDALTGQPLSDPGRATGVIDQVTLYRDNRGPLVRGNRLANNGVGLASTVGTNGMEVRTAAIGTAGTLSTVGITLSTDSVWDDTDIVHILYDEVRIPDLHVYGGLRLQSSPNESLVVKMYGPGALNDAYNRNPTSGAGFTATGRRLEMDDRIGGMLYVVGQPGFPVVLTSIQDDTVGAGVQPDGRPQTDTNNDGIESEPQPGDWRSVRLDQFSHDRNVEITLELEAPEATAPGLNGIPARAQFLGALAPGESGGDDNLRLGFEIQGFLNARDDIDYYSFTAEAGTEVWFDLDRTRFALDTVVELLDADGVLIARSDNSQAETAEAGLLYQTDAIPDGDVNPLQKLNDRYQPHHASGLPKDIWGTNPLDAGMRVVLPGAQGERSPYLFRIRSSNRYSGDDAAKLLDLEQVDGGLTSGVYRFQVRMQEADEVPGSTVRYADVRFAQNGVELIGLPKHSPLLGEAAEDESTDSGFFGSTADNDSFYPSATTPGNRPQELGNLFASDQATLSVAGSLSGTTGFDVDFYTFDVTYNAISNPSAHHGSLVFDLDYADGLSRPNTNVVVFDQSGVPILIGRDSNVAEDRPAPVVNPLDQSGMYDLSRGTVGELDPFIGAVEMPQGTYYVAVTSDRLLPDELLNNPAVRLEPINSVARIAEDRIGSFGGSTALPPVVPVLLDPAFNGTTISPTNLWHVSNLEATTAGHGLTPAFDGSRLGVASAGTAGKIEPNDTLASAQSLEGYIWSLNSQPDIGDAFGNTSTLIPHLTVTAVGNDSFDYYSFVVPSAPARGIFDIDYGTTGNPLTDVNTQIFLYDSAGSLLNLNSDAPATWGSGGSTSTLDSYLEHTFLTPGTYVIAVAATPSLGAAGGVSGTPVRNGGTYTLQLSVDGHPAVTTAGSGGSTFYFGREATGSYGLGGGSIANGSLTSNGFSLKNYSAQDLPVLYFNYRLDADAGDYFRVYVQRRDGAEQLVASSNGAEVTGAVVSLTGDDVWRQSRVSLAPFAGQDLLKLR
ncbi:MAG: pre-peptidase C-terminal domain-containing protein, partial [Pirellulaceae bacterium]|nr:pre-peptidase C-terminal domain-containing protein [Pirellulaceae bacterium]